MVFLSLFNIHVLSYIRSKAPFSSPAALFGEPLDPFWLPLGPHLESLGNHFGIWARPWVPWASIWVLTGPSGPPLWPLGRAHGSLDLWRTSQASALVPLCATPGSSDLCRLGSSHGVHRFFTQSRFASCSLPGSICSHSCVSVW